MSDQTARSSRSQYRRLEALYRDPSFGLLSKSKFALKAKSKFPTLSTKQIQDFIAARTLQQTTQRKPFKGYYKIAAAPRNFQMDIFFIDAFKRSNKYGTFLMMVDILSRKMFIEPIRSRKKDVVITAIGKLVGVAEPLRLFTDDEFNRKDIKDYLSEKGVQLSSIVAKEEHLSKGNRQIGRAS